MHNDTKYHTKYSTNEFQMPVVGLLLGYPTMILHILDNVSLQKKLIFYLLSGYAGLARDHTELHSKNISNKRNFKPAFPQFITKDCEFQ